jgi:hypothetical protein
MAQELNTGVDPRPQTTPAGLMADQGPDAEMQTPTGDSPEGFETDEVSATRGREQGLGMGERELQAQRDPGVELAADQDEIETDEADEDQDDVAELDGDLAVQGDEDGSEETGSGV